MKDLIEMSEGNPGALTCLMGIMQFEKVEDLVNGVKIVSKLKSLNIKGSDIYVLWSDLAERDYSKMANICEKCPDEILLDACSRQDYSGVALISDFL
jgi:hypothetical protein